MGESGQRLFTYPLQQNGRLDIPITPLFSLYQVIVEISVHRFVSSNTDDCGFIVKRENGSNLLRVGREYEDVIKYAGREAEIEPDSIAFRWVCDDGVKLLYVIGTEHDRDVLYKKLYPDPENWLDRNAFKSYFQKLKN